MAKSKHSTCIGLLTSKPVGINEVIDLSKQLMGGKGGDLRGGPRVIKSLEVILKLPESHVLLGEDVAPGGELGSGVVGISVPGEKDQI